MNESPARRRRSSGPYHFQSLRSIPSPQGSRRVKFIKKGVSSKKSLHLLSDTDHDIITLLSEHRVVTTQQLQTLLGIPERTVRYRLERLWELGLVGGMQPYAERGSSPTHWWPSRTADAYARGLPLPRGGEREDPTEAFLRHAAAITGLSAALHRLAPTLGWEVLTWARETEAREEFPSGGERTSAVVPDASLVLRAGEAQYHALVEVDLGTMSIPRATRKIGLYSGWAASRAWAEHHPYLPVVLFLTTTARRAEQILGRAERRLSQASARAYEASEARLLNSLVVAVSDTVYRPEAALADPVWTSRHGGSGLRLADVLSPQWERWERTVEKERAQAEARQARRERLARDPEAQRRVLQERWRDSRTGGVDEYLTHVMALDPEDRDALEALLEETAPMTEAERRAYVFFLHRTHLDDADEPRDIRDRFPLTDEEREAIAALRRLYLDRQRRTIAALHHHYPHLPLLLGAIQRLDEGKLLSGWSRRHLAAEIKRALEKLEVASERLAEYLTWRQGAIEQERRRHGLTARHLVHTPERVGRRLDEEWLRLCPGCERFFPLTEQERTMPWRKPQCPHCGTTEGLLSVSEGEAQGLLDVGDGHVPEVRHRIVPAWARLGRLSLGADQEEP